MPPTWHTRKSGELLPCTDMRSGCCPACGGEHPLAECTACANRSLVRSEIALADMTFPRAFDAWLAARTVNGALDCNVKYLGENSTRTYCEYKEALSKFFGDTL